MSGVSDKAAARRPRDPRLDFFRGLGMCIILVAHVPWNPWTNWIPARYGFSDAAEMFVFCSGMASALAFASVFDQHGWFAGLFRILYRLWQVYWAHICSFMAVFAFVIAADQMLGVDHYVREELKLQAIFDRPAEHLLGLMTLRFVPNYFDILPMYLVVLAMTPIVMALAAVHRALVAVFVIGLWAVAQTGRFDLIADASENRIWFFNPFAWQLVFFTGFSFMRGWLPAPPRDARLVAACVLVVVLAAPISCSSGFSCHAGFGHVPVFGEVYDALSDWWIAKTEQGPLRFVHFLATAYLAYVAVGVRGARLTGAFANLMREIGQQTLAVFLAGLVVGQALGVALDLTGRGFLAVTLANLAGFALLLLAARITSLAKSPPWRRAAKAHAKAGSAEGCDQRLSPGRPIPPGTPMLGVDGRLKGGAEGRLGAEGSRPPVPPSGFDPPSPSKGISPVVGCKGAGAPISGS